MRAFKNYRNYPMRIRLLLCDLDGTLVDSLNDIVTSCNLLLASIDADALPTEVIRPCIGRGVTFLVRGVLAAAGRDGADAEACIARYREIYRAHAMDETRAYPGVAATLAALKQRDDLRLAVVSNKPERASRELLHAMRMDGFFDVIAGGDSFEEMKPSPLPLRRIMERLRVPPAATALIGDSVFDMQAGKAAGIRTVAALYGFQPPEMLKALKPDHTVSAFSETLDIISSEDRAC